MKVAPQAISKVRRARFGGRWVRSDTVVMGFLRGENGNKKYDRSCT